MGTEEGEEEEVGPWGEDACLGMLSSSSACGNRQEDGRACVSGPVIFE